MANIDEYLQQILSARYGEEVRGSIHDAIKNINEESGLSHYMDLKMLGWTVPTECPIQNSVSGNQFIQRVGRANIKITTNGTSGGGLGFNDIAIPFSTNMYTELTPIIIDGSGWNETRTCLCKQGDIIRLYAPRGDYDFWLYYELPNPITMNIDGNEANISNVYGTSDMWSSKTSWAKDEICISDNKLWKCLVSNSNKPSEGNEWTQISLKSCYRPIYEKEIVIGGTVVNNNWAYILHGIDTNKYRIIGIEEGGNWDEKVTFSFNYSVLIIKSYTESYTIPTSRNNIKLLYTEK